ncbi:MAG: alanine racemase [Gammaproteobacteria bacterium]|nr:alanine racemase [Gammaproteobacteria bacterium]TVQ49687.1 MAG: alanine racemase [Gammaproteobacteria bacterium]
MTRPTRARISRAALTANLARVRAAAPGCRVIAVVKANGYGHGLLPVARALSRTDAYAVARIEEALALREAGLAHPVLLLEGPLEAADLDQAARSHLDLVVHTGEQLEMLGHYRGPARFTLWLKFDTGMHRLGFPLEAFDAVMARVQSLTCVARPLRLMTHLACAEERGHPHTQRQLERIRTGLAARGCDLSVANSAAVLSLPEVLQAPAAAAEAATTPCNWVRPGIMLYGISPLPGRDAGAVGLAPAMTFETRLIALRRVATGESVGYGATWTARRDTLIGIAAAGYGDGYPRSLPSGTPVLVGGHRVPLAGRISMDMLAVDLTDHPVTPAVGDTVTLWGRGLPVELVAEAAGTIPYELVCGITQRVAMELVD